jgi:hypothetical protein
MGDHAGLANCSFWSALRLKPVAGSVQKMGRSCRVEEALDNHSGADQLGRPRSTPSPSWPPPRRHLRRHGHQLSTKQGVSSSQRCASARSTGVRCTPAKIRHQPLQRGSAPPSAARPRGCLPPPLQGNRTGPGDRVSQQPIYGRGSPPDARGPAEPRMLMVGRMHENRDF